MRINEITTIPQSDYEGTDLYPHKVSVPDAKPLPGYPNLTYNVREGTPYDSMSRVYKVFAGDYTVAQLTSYPEFRFPIPGYVISTVSVHKDYRGQGIAQALYKLALQQSPIIADSLQTPGGKRNWKNLYNIPGVKIKGYTTISDSALRGAHGHAKNYEDRIDTIMMRGGEYLGSFEQFGENEHVFLFNVVPQKTSLTHHIKGKADPLYSGLDTNTGMIAYIGELPPVRKNPSIEEGTHADERDPNDSLSDVLRAASDRKKIARKSLKKVFQQTRGYDYDKSNSRITEAVNSSSDEQHIKDFIKWSIKQLNITAPFPTWTFSRDQVEASENHHTGSHTTHDHHIWVYIGNRNLIDIMRTVFHELVHHRQGQLGMLKPGCSYPGSPIEALADMMAGKYIKIYGKDHPEIFQ